MSSSGVMSYPDVIQSRKEAIAQRRENEAKGVETSPIESFDQAALFLIIFGILIVTLNLAVLAKMIHKYSRQYVSIICLSVSSAHLVNLVCLLVYTMIRRYDIIPLNWMATMSVSFANWSMLPLCLYVIIDGYFHSQLTRWTSNKMLLLQLLILLAFSVITPIPGAAEVKYFETPTCYNSSNYEEACPFDFASLIQTQTKVLPVLIYGLPLITTTALLIVGISKYKPSLTVGDDDVSKSSLTEGSTVALLTSTWFLIYHFPTVLLILILKIGDSFEDQVELRASKGMIKMAMGFRILNTTANFFVNLICSSLFRHTFSKTCSCLSTRRSKGHKKSQKEYMRSDNSKAVPIEEDQNIDVSELNSLSSFSVTFG